MLGIGLIALVFGNKISPDTPISNYSRQSISTLLLASSVLFKDISQTWAAVELLNFFLNVLH